MSAADLPGTGYVELNNCRRYIELYLRALWDRGFALQYAESDDQIAFNYIDDSDIYLPEQISIKQHSLQYYRAAATYAALTDS